MKRVLIIDDDKYLRKAYSLKLTHDGYEVETSENGEVGITAMRAKKPDLVLLDVVMPGPSGLEVLARVQKDPELSKIPIVVLTNSLRENERRMVSDLGARDYFLKAQTSIEDIMKVVKKYC